MSDIESLLPHREPFLFVDKIEKADEQEIVGYRIFKDTDFFFKGHFPGYPVVPGVILIETLAQCGGAGASMQSTTEGKLYFLAAVEKVKFRRQVRPGDEVKLTIQNLRLSSRMIRQKGTAEVNGELACEAEWLCLVGDKDAQ